MVGARPRRRAVLEQAFGLPLDFCGEFGRLLRELEDDDCVPGGFLSMNQRRTLVFLSRRVREEVDLATDRHLLATCPPNRDNSM